MKSEGFRRHLTYSNVMATIAVFAVLGGGAYAATKIPKNSVGARQLKKNAVTTAKLKNGAVTSAKVKKGSLLASNFKSGQLPRGATGPTGATGATGGAAVTVAAHGGGEDPPALFGPTTNIVMASAPISLPRESDVVITGSMGDKQVECSVDGCQGPGGTDSTIVGLYLEFPNSTGPSPVPGGGISVLGSSFNRIQIPPLSGVIRDIPPGIYTAKLILAGLGISTSVFDNGGADPWITALATDSG